MRAKLIKMPTRFTVGLVWPFSDILPFCICPIGCILTFEVGDMLPYCFEYTRSSFGYIFYPRQYFFNLVHKTICFVIPIYLLITHFSMYRSTTILSRAGSTA